jgi:hypothetical protein
MSRNLKIIRLQGVKKNLLEAMRTHGTSFPHEGPIVFLDLLAKNYQVKKKYSDPVSVFLQPKD